MEESESYSDVLGRFFGKRGGFGRSWSPYSGGLREILFGGLAVLKTGRAVLVLEGIFNCYFQYFNRIIHPSILDLALPRTKGNLLSKKGRKFKTACLLYCITYFFRVKSGFLSSDRMVNCLGRYCSESLSNRC